MMIQILLDNDQPFLATCDDLLPIHMLKPQECLLPVGELGLEDAKLLVVAPDCSSFIVLELDRLDPDRCDPINVLAEDAAETLVAELW